MLKSARFILEEEEEEEEEFMRDLHRIKSGYLQKLSLAVDYLVNEHFCHKYVCKTLRNFPEMQFRIKRFPAREMISTVASGEFEIGFGAFQKKMAGLETIKIFEERSLLVTKKTASRERRFREDPFSFLKGIVLLSSFLDDAEIRPSKKKIREYFKSTWEVDNIALQIKLINEGIGATYIPEKILNSDSIAKKFMILDEIPFCSILKPYGIYYNKQTELSEAGKNFIKNATPG